MKFGGGRIRNLSSRDIWIFGDDKTLVLPAGSASQDLGISDADGLLMDGRRTWFRYRRKDLGGGKIFTDGAIKVCNLGTMTVQDSSEPGCDLEVSITWMGFTCPLSAAGHKSAEWCLAHEGWIVKHL